MPKQSQGIISYISTTTAVATAAANVVGEVVGFNLGESANIIDVTNLQSTAKEKLPGLYDGGEITFNVNMLVTDGGQTKAREMLAARTKGCVMVQLSTAATSQKLAAKGYVTGLSISGAVDNKLSGDLSFAISGGVSWST